LIGHWFASQDSGIQLLANSLGPQISAVRVASQESRFQARRSQAKHRSIV
jgi:hypothetical protein